MGKDRLFSLDDLQQMGGHVPGHVVVGLGNGGKLGIEYAGQLDVVIADDLNVLRHPDAPLPEPGDHADGHQVAAGHNGVEGDLPVQQPVRHTAAEFDGIVSVQQQSFIDGDPGGQMGLPVALHPLDPAGNLKAAFRVGDFPVSAPNQVLHGLFRPLYVVAGDAYVAEGHIEGPAQKADGDAVLPELRQKFFVGGAGAQNNAVHSLVHQVQKLLGLLGGVVVGIAHDDGVALGIHVVHDPPDDLGIEKVGHIRHNEADHAGPGGSHAPGQGVGPVVQLLNGF